MCIFSAVKIVCPLFFFFNCMEIHDLCTVFGLFCIFLFFFLHNYVLILYRQSQKRQTRIFIGIMSSFPLIWTSDFSILTN
jgi:hypothetical protein